MPITNAHPESWRQRRFWAIFFWCGAILIALILAVFFILTHFNALITAITLVSNVGLSWL